MVQKGMWNTIVTPCRETLSSRRVCECWQQMLTPSSATMVCGAEWSGGLTAGGVNNDCTATKDAAARHADTTRPLEEQPVQFHDY
eukprot:12404251-Karenia_brevis.AAC.1